MAPTVERKLTTILCADVEGYSRLMGVDEVATLALLKRHRARLAGLIERHRGRVVNTWGDGLIADFPSVVEAVQSAIEAQRELAAENARLPPEQRLEFRIGINLGDVMVEDGDLYGEGVNVAARLQTLAAPGGITVAGTVHDLVRNKLQVGYAFAGHQQVKNIAEPVAAYHLTLDGSGTTRPRPTPTPPAAAPGPRTPLSPARRTLLQRFLLAAAFFALLNLFTIFEDSGRHIWFHWPVLGIGVLTARRWLRTP